MTNNTFKINTNKQQLKYIQEAIDYAIKNGFPDDFDEFGNNIGKTMINMIEDTITDEYDPNIIHGFCI